MGQREALQLLPDIRQPVEDWFQRIRDMFRLILSLDLLCDVEAFFEEGGTDSLGGGDGPVRAEELSVHSLAVCSNQGGEERWS